MSYPEKFQNMTDEEIASFLELPGNVEALSDLEVTWLLVNKQGVVDTLTFDTLKKFNEKLSTVDLSKQLRPAQLITLLNDTKLRDIEKTKMVDSTTVFDQTGEPIQEMQVEKLNLNAALSNSPNISSSLIESANSFSEIIGIVSVLELVTKQLPSVSTFVESFTQNANKIFSEFYSNVKSLSQGLNLPPELANSIDPGYGFSQAVGGDNNIGPAMAYGGLQPPPSENFDSYKKLEDTLNMTLRQDWKAKNAKPGNPLILEAYAISGRNYDRDGTTGEYVWSACYVNWVLYKTGIDYLKTISPSAYASYGNPVDFGTFKNVRKNDIIVYNSSFGIAQVGFVRGYDPKTDMVSVLGGNLSGTVKVVKLPGLRKTPELYVSHIRRNWSIPPEQDVPLFQITLPTRPGQQTSGTPAPRINYNGNNTGSWGGTLV